MPRMPGVTQAPPPRSWTPGRGALPALPRVIVIHYTAGAEGPAAAEDGAAYDRRRTDGTSTHFFTDSDSIVQEVDTADRAHAALYNGNLIGVQIEMCGTAQTRAQWLDPVSRATITNTARVCLWVMGAHGIPAVRLTPAQVRTGFRGICGHGDITEAYPDDHGSHTDPGALFPWDVLLADIADLQEPDMEISTPNPLSPADKAAYVAAGSPPKDPDTVGRYLQMAPLRSIEAKRAAEAAVADIADLARDVAELARKLDALTAKVDALAAGGVDPAALVDRIATDLAARLEQ